MARNRINPQTPNYGRANFGQIAPYRDRAQEETDTLDEAQGALVPSAASQGTSALDQALKPRGAMFRQGASSGGIAPESRVPGKERGPMWSQPRPGPASTDMGGPTATRQSSLGEDVASGRAQFDGKNWQGVASTTDGGDFSRLSGFNATKFNDLGNATNDAMTSKYVFGRVASKYDPADPQALPKIVAELNSMGIPAQYDGKDAIDFGDGYGYIDVQQAWRPEGGGGPFDWMPKGGGTGGQMNPLSTALLPGAASGGLNIQSLLASGAIDPSDPLWAQILRNLQSGNSA